MCPLYPFHLILLYLCLLLPLLFAVVEGSEELFANWKVNFLPDNGTRVYEQSHEEVTFQCKGCEITTEMQEKYPDLKLVLYSNYPGVASIDNQTYYDGNDFGEQELKSERVVDLKVFKNLSSWNLTINVTGEFLGFARIFPEIQSEGKLVTDFSFARPNGVSEESSSPSHLVSVLRTKTVQSRIFAMSVALLISIAYINMGCAIDLQVVKETLKRPIGPLIGFIAQFVFMPLISFGLGFFFQSPAMRLGLFVTGTSPGGGASNIWTLMFGGNLNLSVTMTAISTFAAFFMMPLWIFTLGPVIISDHDIVIPYNKICTYAICLVVPLSIGLLITRFLPKVSKFLVSILKPFALFLILFILIFGVWANLYMFKLMDWKVILTGMCLPWLGFAFGCTFARLCRRPVEDIIAIAIETGVQNTGVSIFILWYSLDHPLGDIAAVLPVAAATMTPLPLLASLTLMKIREFMGTDTANNVEAFVISEAKNDFKQSESSQMLLDDKPIIKQNGHQLIENGHA